jgi:HNH endonuclease
MTWQRKRLQVLKRDEYKCSICLRPFTKSDLKVQYLIPRRMGGLNSLNNLSSMCSECHALTELQASIIPKLTNIQVTIDLRNKLREMKKKGESYTDIINRCIETYEKTLNKK